MDRRGFMRLMSCAVAGSSVNVAMANAARDQVRGYEDWLARHQGIEAAQVVVTYDLEAVETALHVVLSTEVGRDHTDTAYGIGDHRFDPSALIEVSRQTFIDWYTHKGIHDG